MIKKNRRLSNLSFEPLNRGNLMWCGGWLGAGLALAAMLFSAGLSVDFLLAATRSRCFSLEAPNHTISFLGFSSMSSGSSGRGWCLWDALLTLNLNQLLRW